MKKLKDKKLTSLERDSSLFEQNKPLEIVFAKPQDEEINLKFLKKSQITAHMARWFLDHEYNQLIWSDGVFEILELDARSSGANYANFIEMVHPDDRNMKNQTQENLKTTFKPLEINYRLQFSDGRIKWINEICNTDFDQEGNPIRSYGTIQDITKYKLTEENFKQKEEQFQSLIESIPNGIAIIQEDKFVFVNPSCRKILGGSQEIIFKGKYISKIIHSKSTKNLEINLNAVTKGEQIPTFEEILVRQDGTIFDAEITLIKIPFLGSSAVQLIVNDITDRKKTEEALQKNEERLKDLVATKDKFFSIIAHDLRSPFNSIIGFLELLQANFESLSTFEKKSYLKLIDDDTKKTLKLLDNLLEWAKVQTGKISFEPIKQKLLPIIKNVEETLDSSLKLKLLKLNFVGIPDELDIFCDTNMLTTILRNLISNAIKYSHSGGTITIYAIKSDLDIELYVADNGIGMSKEIIKGIFKISEQVSTPGTANEIGSGLGLILCKDFVEKHNGKIWVESELGIGTKIGFSIPY